MSFPRDCPLNFASAIQFALNIRKNLRKAPSGLLQGAAALPYRHRSLRDIPCWARELTKLGHQVRLMPAKDVKAYVKRNKNDAVDAEAICEAVRRPTMRFVQIKSVEQQGQLMLHRGRELLMRQRTQLINALRAHIAELGIVAAQGREGVKELVAVPNIMSEIEGWTDVVTRTSGFGSRNPCGPRQVVT